MSFGNTILSKIGLGDGGMSSLLPLHTSPRRSLEEHDLSELSPRPDDALLSPDFSRDFAYKNDTSDTLNGSDTESQKMEHNSARSKGKGKAIAFAYQGRPQYARSGTTNAVDDYNMPNGGTERDLKVPPGIWRPNIRTEGRNSSNATPAIRTSLVESIFMGRQERPSERVVRSEVDNTFKIIQRRERQMHKELQKLLDAQGAALERDLAGDDTGKASSEDTKRGISPGSMTSNENSTLSAGSVVPVRQPKRRLLSKRQARIGIARSVTMLADLKNEEDAYIATALAERKAALSKLRNLSSRRKSIVTEMKALEEDNELPIRTEIAAMEDQHRSVCANIEKLEEKLRVLKRTKADLERKLEEARSTLDSSLSGYKGALRQCDQGIVELMKYPGIQVLDTEEMKQQGGRDLAAVMSKHMSGLEFLSLRLERRTAEMARDWWEGEVAVLEQRKAAVDKERAALEEGSEIWQQVVTLLNDFEARLNEALQAVTKQQLNITSDSNPEPILRDQYNALKTTLGELRRLYDYVETQGWNLLIAAIGAELAHFEELKEFLAEVIRDAGYDDGIITPISQSNNLVDVHEDTNTHLELNGDEDEELSRSVVRRWDNTDGQQDRDVDHNHDTPPIDLLPGTEEHRDESDNEVPPGLLSEVLQPHHESEDEHHPNDVPAEFLSMHSSPPQMRFPIRRKSSGNEVPPDLLAESRRDEDTVD
ncbi:hypothetical protein GGS26DRAFT_558207 [Hypomontagnella submonticulosa]|nr:hypothetical protein GGS26DRAFT_558207 [Hypomontagnella submonticulosa]